MRPAAIVCVSLCLTALRTVVIVPAAESTSASYYVSSSMGNDNNNGLSPAAAFATVSKVNTLDLEPGDRVLFKCGDVWQADPLLINQSGTSSAPIEFSSYPAGCLDKPILSGSRAIGAWMLDSGSIYRADLPAGDFPLGINQLFRDGQRLTLGRWPNLDAPNAGYSFVDAHSAGSSQIGDNELPAGDWSGAIVHIKNIRWSMLARQVISSSGQTLVLNQGLSCLVSSWAGCQGWGFFVNNSRNTLDQEGEWYYDPNTSRVYLYSTGGLPSNVEGSVVQATGSSVRDAGVMLSTGAATAYVILDNITIKNWFNDGIGTPGGMNHDIYHHITVRNVTIQDVNAAGVNLSSWLERPSDGRQGLRGGHDLLFTHNVIDGANAFGVTGYFADSTFENNTLRNIALIKNLGRSGMGCGLTASECTENGDGFRIRLYAVQDSGHGNTLRQNTLEKIGYNGVDVFGPDNILVNNFITQACYSKADCGAVRTFGGDDLASTGVYNIQLSNNVIVDIPGNVDGCEASRAAFGMGLYIDHYSRDVVASGNTIISTTVSGIVYQRSTGQITGNTVFNASAGTEYSGQIDLGGSETRVSLSHNALYGLKSNAWTLYVFSLSNIVASDQNYFFQPYVNQHIAYGPGWTRATFAAWQALSGQDAQSKTNWFTQPAGEASRARILYNSTPASQAIDLGSRQYLDLDQAPVIGSLVLPPFASRILVDNGPAPLSLQGIYPALAAASQAADFTLTVFGTGFTASSVVRWDGSDRLTGFIDSTHLSAAISAADVSGLGEHDVTVWEGGMETPPVIFHVVAQVFDAYLPLATR
jgi:hypothetical protein